MYPRVGIDEVGRGPVAGPVTICIFILKHDISFFKKGIRDSKKLNHQKREIIYEKLLTLKQEGIVDWVVSSLPAEAVDNLGISVCIKNLIKEGLLKLKIPHHAYILLDGSLKAPPEYENQQTIIKGDTLHEAIALASIVAKVTRDRYMEDIAPMYPKYFFEEHKGYGTKNHYKAIKQYGLTPLHRKTYLKSVV